MQGFNDDYEVCNCRKVTIADIKISINKNGAKTLRDIQEFSGAGTECRYCMFPEADNGKVKKNIYCKNILDDFKEVLIG